LSKKQCFYPLQINGLFSEKSGHFPAKRGHFSTTGFCWFQGSVSAELQPDKWAYAKARNLHGKANAEKMTVPLFVKDLH